MVSDHHVSEVSRALRDLLEPIAAQVYFSPEAHTAYQALGFGPSPGSYEGVALPDGPAYFTSRGSCLGQVPGELVAAAFAVFNPAVVVPAVAFGWSITDAATIAEARTAGAVAQLERILGDQPEGLDRALLLLGRAAEPLPVAGRPLYAGLVALGRPGDGLAHMWRVADRLREYRGDSHTASWSAAGLDAVEIGLLTELWWGLPMRTYVRSRAWSPEQLDDAESRLRERGLIEGDGFSQSGAALRTEIELATDRQMRPAVEALGADVDELLALLAPWAAAIKAAGGYFARGPGDLARAAGRS
jgi:hypothetical protein